LTSPCSETVSGSARRAHCALAREPPGWDPTSARTAASTVRRQPCGDGEPPFDHGTTHGRVGRSAARSPSSSTPSIDSGSCARAHAPAPAAPPLPPEVETSTSVLRRSRPIRRRSPGTPGSAVSRERKMRASSSSAAVPDSSASPGAASASRCASTTILRPERPGRTPSTVSSPVVPSTVRAWSWRRETRNPAPRSVDATRSARAASPVLPGRRSGNAAASSISELRMPVPLYARAPSKASAASRVVAGRGRPSSENATTKTASRAGTKAAR
jgi:hypothetical protein